MQHVILPPGQWPINQGARDSRRFRYARAQSIGARTWPASPLKCLGCSAHVQPMTRRPSCSIGVRKRHSHSPGICAIPNRLGTRHIVVHNAIRLAGTQSNNDRCQLCATIDHNNNHVCGTNKNWHRCFLYLAVAAGSTATIKKNTHATER